MRAAAADEWLTVREAALATGVRVGGIYSMINRKKISAELKSVGKGARVLVVRPREVLGLRINADTYTAE